MTMEESALKVVCPGCSSHYAMPPHLMGPAGARVVCPSCWLPFVVGPNGSVASWPEAHVTPPPPSGAPPRPPAAPRSRAEIAAPVAESGSSAVTNGVTPADPRLAAAIAQLRAVEPEPGAFTAAAAEGRLFARFGPAIADAFAAWSSDDAHRAAPDAFVRALETLAGVALAPRPPG